MQKCSICGHPERRKIEAMLVERVPLRNIAPQFGVSIWAINRHKKNCLAGKVERKQAKQEARALETVADKMRWLWQETSELYSTVKTENDRREQRCTLAELRQQTVLQQELAAPEAAQDWPPVLKVIYDALADEPAARLKVARALAALEEGALAHTG